ncbi:aldo/keto reductase [Streptococcus chenjunshii]|uniref:Aldo/keto reductase n=1 Tax=Streptococcus chenjunshii TaxID=2173853 RepID=A0A372KRG8_9STRE|nr:aldo/keto reductase [Streptococcus chenjunshii]AXQ78493.1 aldo/keto reductase [Streptococcus chenjunshii]RFU52046.1 aldo/keto reductase [Streptococcus chenjunshii]RFU54238.1 aldo/keto reductase [Streptococcus chenjunshii]
MRTIALNDGHTIPAVGFGVFLIPADGSTYTAVKEALAAGYRHIDTAQAYFNEAEVGRAIADSGIPREEIYVTTKLWLQDYAYDLAVKGINSSLERLGLDYIDLLLLHQPYGEVEQAWKALEEAQTAGKIKSIGVSNMTPTLWQRYVPHFNTVPAVNQVELHPYSQQKELRALLAKDKVIVEAWGPLGQGNKELLSDPAVVKLAKKYGKDVGQIILRFENQEGIVVLPKSTKPERIKSNLNIFDFELTPSELEELRALDTGKGAHDPDAPGVGEYLLSNYDIHADD